MKLKREKEFNLKLGRLHQFLKASDFEVIVIGTQSNFSWLSCGGSSHVLLTTDAAVTYLVITEDERFVVAHTMDGQRHQEEELAGMGFQSVFVEWFGDSLEEVVIKLVNDRKFLSDVPLGSQPGGLAAFYQFHYPLTEGDMDRFREIDQNAEMIMRKVVDRTRPGMLETDVESMLTCEISKAGYFPVVMLIGSDERLFNYRHMIAKPKPIDSYLMLIVAFRKYGLNAILTRSVYFGTKLPVEIAEKFEAASIIAANCISHSVPGKKFSSILELQKGLYADMGYPEEWKNHFQGGLTGYVVNDSSLCFDPDAVMVSDQTYNWFITITGVNTEDTYLSHGNDGEILTTTGAWPLKSYRTLDSKEIQLPQILMK